MKRILIITVVVTSVLQYIGCYQSPKKAGEQLSNKLPEQLTSSVDSFKNSPTHLVLTEKTIDSTPDHALLQVVYDNLSAGLGEDYEQEYSKVMTWNKSRQAIYMIWNLEAEVNNGGYNQFYANSSGQFYIHLPEALKLVGASQFADLTERANRTYQKEKEKITKQQDGTLEGFSKSYNDNPLNKFDDEFYALYKKEPIGELVVAYIKKHKEDFIGR